jgi:hypothetical protein
VVGEQQPFHIPLNQFNVRLKLVYDSNLIVWLLMVKVTVEMVVLPQPQQPFPVRAAPKRQWPPSSYSLRLESSGFSVAVVLGTCQNEK